MREVWSRDFFPFAKRQSFSKLGFHSLLRQHTLARRLKIFASQPERLKLGINHSALRQLLLRW